MPSKYLPCLCAFREVAAPPSGEAWRVDSASLRVRERYPSPFAIDALIDRFAAGQHGVVTRRQLLEAGLEPGTVDRRFGAGRLRSLHRGVYLVGPVAGAHAPEMAACLACGPGAVVSHRSAAALWRMMVRPRDVRSIHVSVRGRGPRRPGVTVHRPVHLHSDEVTTCDGIPVTTPARTLYDLAGTVSPRRLERALAEALALRRATAEEIAGIAERHAGRPGSRRLARALGHSGPRLTRSEAEARFLDLVRQARLPRPKINAVVCGYEVDFHWASEGLVVEIDGFAFHSSRRAFERDRVRDGELIAAGRRVVRITWRQLVSEPLAVVARVSRALAAPRGYRTTDPRA